MGMILATGMRESLYVNHSPDFSERGEKKKCRLVTHFKPNEGCAMPVGR
tara:strand:+ start:131 stop:277 length:147 start_codon:yes stop_codon:yes gene_type:complete